MSQNPSPSSDRQSLKRTVGMGGAVALGLGSIVGTGVFVTLGLAAGLVGSYVSLALLLAGMLAICNGLSSAQLAACTPVSGGTYTYGYRFLNPNFGFAAGWLFLCAKSASAATAALGFGSYLMQLVPSLGSSPRLWAATAVTLITLLACRGLQRSNFVNGLMVSFTISILVIYVVMVWVSLQSGSMTDGQHLVAGHEPITNFGGFRGLGEAAALLFVAYTGYGRVATLGEEIIDPARNIPRAVVVTLILSFLLYLAVAYVSNAAVGPALYEKATRESGAPLQYVAKSLGKEGLASWLSVAALIALLGVLLNLVLGLSRVVLAMARGQDLPVGLAALDREQRPVAAVIFCGVVILVLLMIGDIKLTWSLSAMTVLCYYAITNLAALRMPAEFRLYPRWCAWLGLAGCLSLGVWIEWPAMKTAGGILLLGGVWRLLWRRFKNG